MRTRARSRGNEQEDCYGTFKKLVRNSECSKSDNSKKLSVIFICINRILPEITFQFYSLFFRHQQTAEYIGDLKRANGALVSAYEKAKKRHASRLKKFEAQLITMAEKNQFQVRRKLLL